MGVVVVLALTALHGLWFYRSTLAREDARAILGESEAKRDALREEVRTRAAQLDVGAIEALNEKVVAANALIDSRRFSWTQFLSDLERVLPARVFVHSISPSIQKEGISLRLSTISKEPADLVDFLNELELSPLFLRAYPQNEREDTLQTLGRGIASDVEVLYVPFGFTRGEAEAEVEKEEPVEAGSPRPVKGAGAAPPPGEKPGAEAKKPVEMGPLPPPVKGASPPSEEPEAEADKPAEMEPFLVKGASPPSGKPGAEAEKPVEMGPLPPPVKGASPPSGKPGAEAEKPVEMGPLPPPVKGASPPSGKPGAETEKPVEMGPLPPPVKGASPPSGKPGAEAEKPMEAEGSRPAKDVDTAPSRSEEPETEQEREKEAQP
jgi:Tfp pilus assembly protein PilN